MGEKTAIAWTDHTFNPWMGCSTVSEGCVNCYARALVKRRFGLKVWGRNRPRHRTSSQTWGRPKKWDTEARVNGKRRRVFCGSLCDVFDGHGAVKPWLQELWVLIAQAKMLDWQLLTKRPERIVESLPVAWGDGWPNVWLGTSIESGEYSARARLLAQVPAVVRFVSYAPAIGPPGDLSLEGIDWVIYGGESGHRFRRHDVRWASDIRMRCREAGAAFFFKQSPAPRPGLGNTLDGVTVKEFPVPRHANRIAHPAG